MSSKFVNQITNWVFKDKLTTGLCGGLPLVFMLIATIMLANRTFVIFPANNLGDRLYALTDLEWNGKSQIEEFAFDKKRLKLKYLLQEGAPNPMVFFSFTLGTTEKPLDLSDCHSITLQIKEATPERTVLFIKTFLPGVSRTEAKDAITLRHNQYTMPLSPGRRQYTIQLKDFGTQSWWLDTVKLRQELLPAETFQKVVSFDMQFNRTSSDYQLHRHEQITVEKICFHRNPSPLCYFLFGLMITYLAWLMLVLLRRRNPREPPLLLQGKPLEVTMHREQELLQVKEFIEANYGLADISTRMIAQRLGLSSARVNELLKEEYQLTFKQLINKLRIEEAKRLLRETDLRITEIAVSIGFNNATYFNNLFKSFEQTTPSDYREKTKNNL